MFVLYDHMLSYAIQGANMNVDIGGLFEIDPLTLVSKT